MREPWEFVALSHDPGIDPLEPDGSEVSDWKPQGGLVSGEEIKNCAQLIQEFHNCEVLLDHHVQPLLNRWRQEGFEEESAATAMNRVRASFILIESILMQELRFLKTHS